MWKQLSCLGTMMTRDSGRMRLLMTGPKKWQEWGWSLRNMLIWPTTVLWEFEHHTFELEATTNSPWWKNRPSFTIPQLPHPSTILHCGPTPCISECPIGATETSNTAQPGNVYFPITEFCSSLTNKPCFLKMEHL